MTRKSAAQRLIGLDDYSSTICDNPLITMRENHNGGETTQKEYAAYLGVGASVVTQAENGMYSLIPVDYRAKIKNIMTVNAQYQQHRKEKRLFFFEPIDFPDYPAKRKPMQALLEHFDMASHEFGSKACIANPEIWKMSTTKTIMTSNFHEFLVTVGIDEKWIDQFNAGLRHNATSSVRLPTTS